MLLKSATLLALFAILVTSKETNRENAADKDKRHFEHGHSSGWFEEFYILLRQTSF